MFRSRRKRAPVLAVSAAALALLAAVAYGAAGHSYRGKTSQRQPISFRVSGGFIRRLDYKVVDHCGRGRNLVNHDYGFTPLRISRGKFAGTFLDPAHHGKATIRGTIHHGLASGTLTDRTRNARTRRVCRGTAKFHLHRR